MTENKIKIPIEVSARHVHLCREDLEKLFGPGYELQVERELSQPGMFAAKETVDVVCKDCSAEKKKEGELKRVRIVGPLRDYTQLELPITDAIRLGAKIPPIRVSGNHEGTPGFELVGTHGRVIKEQGLVVAKRHIHVSDKEAKDLGLTDGQSVAVKAGQPGERSLVFRDVTVRVDEKYKLTCHIDTDEGNAASLGRESEAELLV